MLLDTVVDLIPNPLEGSAELVENADGELEEYVLSDRARPCAFVFKTTSDQYGKYSYVKVMSGNLTPMTLVNARTGETSSWAACIS